LRSFVSCPAGASNINGPTVADPETGVLFVTTQRLCRSENMVPGEKMDEPEDPKTTGKTVARWVVANRGDLRGPQGLPIWKPPYSRIIAIDMSTGEFLWETPNGDTPEFIRNHPALRGLKIPPTGQTVHAVMMPTKTLLLTAPGVDPVLYALDKKTGRRLATVKLPAPGQYGMMGYLHRGRQYVVVQVGSPTHPGSLVALRLPRRANASPGAR
jgi:quinoprotein glucose dehydrogenase